MPQPKPVAYPNLVDQIKAAVEAHKAAHDAVDNHAQEHLKVLDARRAQLRAGHMAKQLIQGDGKP